MKTASAALVSYLNTNNKYNVSELYNIDLPQVKKVQGHKLDPYVLGLWRLNESAGAIDSGPYGYDLSENTGLGGVASANVTGLIADGGTARGPFASSRLYRTNALTLPALAGEATVEAWVKLASTGWTLGTVFGFYLSTINMFVFRITSTRFLQLLWTGGGVNRTAQDASTALAVNTLYHVAARRRNVSGGQQADLFVNGVKVFTSATLTSCDNASSYLSVGGHPGSVDNFTGVIDDVRVSSIARTDAEIKDSYTRGSAGAALSLAYTNADFNAMGYTSAPIKRTGLRQARGGETSTINLTLASGSKGAPSINGVVPAAAAVLGYLDGAAVNVYKLFQPTWGDYSLGVIPWFSGTVEGPEPSASEVKMTVKSKLAILNQAMPRNVYQAMCSHAVYDAGCGATKQVRTVTTVSGSTPTSININTSMTWGSEAADFYALSTVTIAGIERQITASTANNGSGGITLTLAVPLPSAPGAGVSVPILLGCDKSSDGTRGCGPRFSNTSRFRGFPFVPRPESVR